MVQVRGADAVYDTLPLSCRLHRARVSRSFARRFPFYPHICVCVCFIFAFRARFLFVFDALPVRWKNHNKSHRCIRCTQTHTCVCTVERWKTNHKAASTSDAHIFSIFPLDARTSCQGCSLLTPLCSPIDRQRQPPTTCATRRAIRVASVCIGKLKMVAIVALLRPCPACTPIPPTAAFPPSISHFKCSGLKCICISDSTTVDRTGAGIGNDRYFSVYFHYLPARSCQRMWVCGVVLSCKTASTASGDRPGVQEEIQNIRSAGLLKQLLDWRSFESGK